MDKSNTIYPGDAYAYSSETGIQRNNHNSNKNLLRALGRRFIKEVSLLTFKPEKKTSSSTPIEKQIPDRVVSVPNLYRINSQIKLYAPTHGVTDIPHHASTPHLLSDCQKTLVTTKIEGLVNQSMFTRVL